MTEISRDVRMIDQYLEKIDKLSDVDYGDFKRKAGHYLIRLQDSLAARSEPVITQTLQKLRMDVIYNPKQDIETAREKLLTSLSSLRDALDI